MRKSVVLMLLMLFPQMAIAVEWVRLNGDEAKMALTDRSLTYENATQVFYASGRTLYTAGEPSWGFWRIEGDLYCSQWPPGDRWDCYALERSTDGAEIRFLDSEGRPFPGRYSD